MDQYGAHGPGLQVAMFRDRNLPPPDEVEAFASEARTTFLEST